MTKQDLNKSRGQGFRSHFKPRMARFSVHAAVLSAALLLVACATQTTAPAPAPKVEALPELMHQGETAQAAGDKDKAREAYRAAAKSDPTSKAPWLKLAEGYFESADYGNAVLAAQEVLHRDSSDTVAAGILAVSGLRVSTSALSMLRQQSSINAGTRSEAESLARSLRDVLGESVLVPRPTAEAASAPPRTRARASVNAASAARAAAPASAPRVVVLKPALPPAPTPAPKATTATAGNPFDKLK